MRLTKFQGASIISTGHYLPEAVVPTSALGLDTDELIRLTGVRSRHVASNDHATSDLVVEASRRAIAGTDVAIDRVFVATVTPDHPSPATAPLVQDRLGLDRVPAMDLGAACAGFGYALDLAARCILSGDRGVLIGAGECRFRTLSDAAPGVRVLFGDGAGAAVVAPTGTSQGSLELVATLVGADGRGHAAIRVEAGGSRRPTTLDTVRAGQHSLRMEDGPQVFFQATEGLVQVAQDLMKPLGLTPKDIDLVVPHQPNLRILERVARLVRIPLDRFALEIETVGNVGGASALIALDRAWRSGRISPGDRVLLLTAGAGFTAAAAILEASS
jgi:3-oxoacyl-[acyl-carrier-protein] synthase-3